MENMLHLTPSHASSIPDGFVLPAGHLRPATAAGVVSLPVVDMSSGRDEVRRAILDAGKEHGFFQASFINCSQQSASFI
jgi:2'-deoxymugineic-acid 2'-dioxygenase / mugineic-acid 3-dioxygenase